MSSKSIVHAFSFALTFSFMLIGAPEAFAADGEAEMMCCDKWNGYAVQNDASGKYYAVVQKGLQKKTREKVGNMNGYDSEEEAQEVADEEAEDRNKG